MSTTINVPRDTTLQEIKEAIDNQNSILSVLMAGSLGDVVADPRAVRGIVRSGGASGVFGYGDQFSYDWYDSVSNVTYECPHNLVSFDDVELVSGETAYGMWLQWHYATPYAMPFDAKEAFYYATEALPAGTYYITIGYSWGEFVSGDMFKFTLTQALPIGGQLVFDSDGYETALAGTTISAYASSSTTEATESVALTKITAASGTSLGTLSNGAPTENLNSITCTARGSNRWKTSAIRQWLNSTAGIGEWWEPQTEFDRPPTQLATYPGFMSGYNDDFLSAIQKVKVQTSVNTVIGGGTDETYDYFFLPALEQLNITPQVSGIEGDTWGYWKQATGSSEKIAATNVAGTFPITYAISSKTSGQPVRLRSAYRGYASSTWGVSSAGAVSHYSASYAFRCAPACVFC